MIVCNLRRPRSRVSFVSAAVASLALCMFASTVWDPCASAYLAFPQAIAQLERRHRTPMASQYQFHSGPRALVDEFDGSHSLEIGKPIVGTVSRFTLFGAYIDIGDNQWAYLPVRDIARPPVRYPSQALQIGDSLLVWVRSEGDGNSPTDPILVSAVLHRSLSLAGYNVTYEDVLHPQDGETHVQNVTLVKIVETGCLALLPSGVQLIVRQNSRNRNDVPEQFSIGQQVPVVLNRMGWDQERAFNTRDRMDASYTEAKKWQLSLQFKEGQVVDALVVAIEKHQIIVEVNGTDVSMPKTEISQAPAPSFDLHDMFSAGQKIKAYVNAVQPYSSGSLLSTGALETSSGQMVSDMEGVFEHAEETARLYRAKMAKKRAEMRARVRAAFGDQ